MRKSTITAVFKADIKRVWEVVTNNNKFDEMNGSEELT